MTFVRDKNSGALLNTDDAYYKALIIRRRDKEATAELKAQMDLMQAEFAGIKRLLERLVEDRITDDCTNT